MKISVKFIGSSIFVFSFVCILFNGSQSLFMQSEMALKERREQTRQTLNRILNLQIEARDEIVALKDYLLLGNNPTDMVRYQKSKSKFQITLQELQLLLPASADLEVIHRRHQELIRLADSLKEYQKIDLPRLQQDIRAINSFSKNIEISLDFLVDSIQQQEKQAEAQVLQIQQTVVFTQTLILGIIFLVFALQFALILLPVIRSFRELRLGVQKLGAGDWYYQVKIQSGDEIEEVGNYFNQMAAQLSELYQNLEEKIREITQTNNLLNQEISDRIQTEADLHKTLQQLQLSQEIIQLEKMSSLAKMVGGIAHEINNPVTFISANLTHVNNYLQDLIYLISIYQRYYPESVPEIQEFIEAIDFDFLQEDAIKIIESMAFGATRIKDIVQSLRTFSRLDEADCKKVDIHKNLESTLLILHHRLQSNFYPSAITVIKNYDDLPLVECYPSQLNQVFMNIIVNAIDALEDRNHPQNLASNSQLNLTPLISPTISISTHLISPNEIEIRIADNGSGIPPEIQSKIFDPFFTTKDVGKGTGLGLSVSYQIIVDKHGGELTCDSQLGQKTEFRIKIPIKLPKISPLEIIEKPKTKQLN
ncbi:Integral membrane sensor signal transduction histidine kinase [Planktothrix serta PCC 8927]|uniref:histidine kinase n=1 Tax=Planktothrix serta PCC 8927 TaxID=671068 RepID=A0A7Z9BTQ9_9CYAN|nr:ATP-binding protein [Planktothrix serta]VXD21013.1 Integral membrane sensor signal transduction histidine kinase [Planktothrix serta PCC 8927]